MRKKKKNSKDNLLSAIKQSRSRDWGFNPTNRVIQDKRKKQKREACRSRIDEE
jgi:hypothetical protein